MLFYGISIKEFPEFKRQKKEFIFLIFLNMIL
jgi:hypothetical protein